MLVWIKKKLIEHQDSKFMRKPTTVGVSYKDQSINLDYAKYYNCTFENCNFIYSGSRCLEPEQIKLQFSNVQL